MGSDRHQCVSGMWQLCTASYYLSTQLTSPMQPPSATLPTTSLTSLSTSHHPLKEMVSVVCLPVLFIYFLLSPDSPFSYFLFPITSSFPWWTVVYIVLLVHVLISFPFPSSLFLFFPLLVSSVVIPSSERCGEYCLPCCCLYLYTSLSPF